METTTKTKWTRKYHGTHLEDIPAIGKKLNMSILVYLPKQTSGCTLSDELSYRNETDSVLSVLYLTNGTAGRFLHVACPEKLTISILCKVCMRQWFNCNKKT
jgi:hypothetical protein